MKRARFILFNLQVFQSSLIIIQHPKDPCTIYLHEWSVLMVNVGTSRLNPMGHESYVIHSCHRPTSLLRVGILFAGP